MELSCEQMIKLRSGLLALACNETGVFNPMAVTAEEHAVFYAFLHFLDGANACPLGLWQQLGIMFQGDCRMLRDGSRKNNAGKEREARLEMADLRRIESLLKKTGVANEEGISLDFLEQHPDAPELEYTADRRDNGNAGRQGTQA